MNKFLPLLLSFFIFKSLNFNAQSTCSSAQAVCTGTGNVIPAATSGTAAAGPNYGCLGSQPNPAWSFIQVGTSGNLTIQMSGTGGGDIDYIAYGPFASLAGACSALTAGNTVGCSFSGSSVETLNLVGAVAGNFYVILTTNFSGISQNVSFTQTGGSGSLNCTNVCNITAITNSVGACNAVTNQYSTTGTISVNGVPTAGSMTITNSCGGTPIVYNFPFPNPITYNFTGLTSNGANCSINAQFSSLVTCSMSISYTAPAACNTCAVNASNSGSVCSGAGNVTLSATTTTNVASVLWSGPGAFSSSSNPATVVAPTSSGAYTIVGTAVSGNTCSSVTNITVVPLPNVVITPNANPICTGNNVTLTATGATNYTWSTGSNASSIVQTPLINTTYTITGANGACTNTAALTVTVSAPPTVSASGPLTPVCSGLTSTLTGSGATTYTWNPGNLTGTSVTVSPTSTTTYTVVGSVGSCTSSATVAVNVIPGPTLSALASPVSICQGESSNLLANGALTYTWQPVNLNGNLITVSPAATTLFTVSGTNAAGCVGSTTVNLTVIPNPTISFSPLTPSVCIGSSVNITASGAVTYTWNPGNINSANVNVSPAVNTTYTVQGFDGTCTGSNTVLVTVLPNVTVTATSNTNVVCAGTNVTLTASGANTYTWNPGGLTNTIEVVTPAISTTYTLIGSNGACSSSTTIAITVNPLPTIIPNASPTSVCAGSSSTLSATGAVSYTWNPGSLIGTPQTVTPPVTTNYTVSGTSALGCTNSETITVTVNPIPAVSGAAAPSTICAGSTSTLTGSGATTYTWNPGNIIGSSVTVTPLTSTQYTVVGDALGCSAQNTVDVIVQAPPAVSTIANSPSICVGQTSTLTASGATSYTWNPGGLTGTSVTVSPVSTTIYTVTGDNGICTSTSTVALTVNPLPVITANASPTNICVGSSSTLTATGATSYTWNPGALTGSNIAVSPAITTNYTVVGTNASGCSNTAAVTVSVNSLPILTLSANPSAICVGATATLTGAGATSYIWNPGALTGANVTVSPLASTIYTAIGANGACVTNQTLQLIVNPNPTIVAGASPTNICSGSSTTLSASGALSFTWNPGNLIGANQTVSLITTTNYTVIGTNASGCTSSAVVNVSVTPNPTVNLSASPSTICAGQIATITPAGATNYTLNPGALTGTSFTVTPAITTNYTVTGSNGNCTNTQTITITVNPLPIVSATANPNSICVGSTSTLTASGAISYTWNPGNLTGTSVTVSPASTIVYTVAGVNAFGCTNTNTTLLTVNPLPTITASGSPTNICSGSSTTLTASGGISYIWNPGGLIGPVVTVTPTITTTYTVFGTNAFGCFNTAQTTISVTPIPTLSPVANPTAICVGQTATLTSTGATTYTWNPGLLSGSSVTVSPAATTLYTLTGANGICNSTTTLNLVVNPNPTITATGSPTQICAGSSTTLSATGALTYTWNPGSLTGSSVSVSPIVTTNYTVTGTNASGCIGTRTLDLIVNPNLTPTIAASSSSVCSGNTVTLTAVLLGGPFTSTWQPGGLTSGAITVTPNITTTYTLTTTNVSGCVNTATRTITVAPTPTLSVTSGSTICSGASATLIASGATSYTWNPGGVINSSVSVSPITTTTYTVIGASGSCTSSANSTVIVNPTPTLNLSASSLSICSGNSSTLTATGANSYTWNPGALTGSNIIVSPLITTVYTATGVTSSGCSSTNTILINVTPTPTITASANSPSICLGSSSTLTASGATTYTWLPTLATGSTTVVSPLVNNTYTVNGANGVCVTSQTVNVTVLPIPVLIAGAFPNPICSGQTASLGATGAVSYTWNPGGLTGSLVTVTPSVSTNYSLTGSGLNGCSASTVITVTVNTTPTISVTSPTAPICLGSSVTVVASGASTYTWNPGNLTGSSQTLSPIVNTTYTVDGASASGCTASTVFTISVIPSPTVTISATSTNVCSGINTTLTATGATNYTWLPSNNTGSTSVETPTTTQAYTVIASDAVCPSNTVTSQITISVTPAPTITASASPTVICSGANATLSVIQIPGETYTWTATSFTGAIGVVNPTTTTIYTVTAQNAAGCSNTTIVTVSVNPIPNVTITSSGTSSICAGGTLTLTASGANSYAWLPVTSSGTSIIVSPTSTSTFSVTGTDVNGCSSQAVFTVNVFPASLTITPSTNTICSGNSVTLTAGGATTYTWLPSNATSTTVIETPTVNTTYTLIGDNGICSLTQTINITVNPNPTVTASISNTQVCSGFNVTLTATGASSYTWNPIGVTGVSVVANPTVNTTYTVIGISGGCSSTATVDVFITPGPIVTITPSSTLVCLGNSATLTVSGATSYTWNLSTLTGTSVVVTPTVSTTYIVSGDDGTGTGCINIQTINLPVLTTPTVTASSSATALCLGETATLTANGALTYTWEPGMLTTNSIVVSPTITTQYTVTGSNGSCGTSTALITLTVNAIPTATASVSGTISCTTPSLDLLGAATPTNVNYFWNGPFSYTSSVQSPTGIAITGNYTLTVTDATTGCSSSATTAVTTDSSIPTISVTASGDIGCNNSSVTLTVATSATNAAYAWSGPSAFSSTATVITATLAGNYSLTVTDITANCPASTIVIVNTNTTVPITATILPATCNGTTTNNDGSIIISGYGISDKTDYVYGITYTGTATYTTANVIPASGLITNTLVNPSVITPITIRFFGANGCIKDTTLFLIPTSCITNTVFGIAKAVSSATLQSNGSYNVNYKIVVKNTSAQTLNNIVLYEDLAQTFPLPTTFSIISSPTIITSASGLTLEPAFTGSIQTLLTNTLSVLNPNSTDTIVFGLNIKPNGKFGPFNNTVLGFAQLAPGVVLSDSSNTGLHADPDLNGNPTDNDLPTVLNLTPNLFFGLTKQGVISEKLSDGSYDLSYTITVHNLGNDTLKNVSLKDTLFNTTVKQPAIYTLKNGPITTGSLVANTNYNGNTDVDLVTSSLCIMPPGIVSSVSFTINVMPDTVTVFKNSAHGVAISSAQNNTVTDVSNDGNNPDSNNNGVWNEAADNVVTILTIKSNTLFVPEGFTPNGDGKNETWVIKGLPAGNKVTVYNRWGSKVYEKTEYDNSWNGFANVGATLGSNKLPQGTYYYIIEFTDGAIKPMNGFLILHY